MKPTTPDINGAVRQSVGLIVSPAGLLHAVVVGVCAWSFALAWGRWVSPLSPWVFVLVALGWVVLYALAAHIQMGFPVERLMRNDTWTFLPLLVTLPCIWFSERSGLPGWLFFMVVCSGFATVWLGLSRTGVSSGSQFTTVRYFVPPMLVAFGLAWVSREIHSTLFGYSLIVLAVGAVAALKAWQTIGYSGERLRLGISDQVGMIVAITLVIVFAGLFSALSIAKHLNIQSAVGDLGIYEELVYNLSVGDWAEFSRYLGKHMHFDLVVFLVVPFYRVFGQQTWVLLVTQAVALAGGALPIYLLGKRETNQITLGLAIAVAYLLFPVLQWVYRFDFHSIAFAPVFLLSAFCALRAEKVKAYWVFVVLAIICKEEVSLTIMALGVFALLFTRKRTWGVATIALGAIWFLAVTQVVVPMFRPADAESYSVIAREYSGFGNTTSEVIRTLLTEPQRVASWVFIPRKIEYVVYLLLPVGFMIFLAEPIAALVAAPGVATVFLATDVAVTLPGFHYGAAVIPWVAVMAISATTRVLPLLRESHHSRWLGGVTAFVLTCALLTSFLLAPVPWSRVGSWEMLRLTERGLILNRIAKLIPHGTTVWTANRVGPHVIRGRHLTTISLDGPGNVVIGADEVCQDYVLMDLTERKHPDGPGASDLLLPLLSPDSPFGVRAFEANFVLLERGYSKDDNERVADYIATHRSYTVGELPAQTGSSGTALSGIDQPGYLAFGPYVGLPSGLYHVVFTLKVGECTDQVVARIEVSSPEDTFVSRQLTGLDFEEIDQPQDFALQFISQPDIVYEFRIYFTGAVDLSYTNVTVEPAEEVTVALNREVILYLQSDLYGVKEVDYEQGTVTLARGEPTQPNSAVLEYLQNQYEFRAPELIPPEGLGQRLPGGALYADPAVNPAGFTATGPWMKLPAGKYEAEYWLRVGDNTITEPVASLQVGSYAPAPEWLGGSQELRGVDFSQAKVAQPFVVPFELNYQQAAKAVIQFTLYSYAKSELWLERVVVRRINDIYDNPVPRN